MFYACMPSFSFIPLWFLRRRCFNIFTKIDPFCRADNQSNSPIWTKVVWNVEDYSINISVYFFQISPMRQKKLSISSFSHYKSMGTISCHCNQSSYPIGIKTQLFVPSTYKCYMWNMKKTGLTASEEMSFENVDRRTDGRQTDGRTTDTFLYYKLTNEPSAQVSKKQYLTNKMHLC